MGRRRIRVVIMGAGGRDFHNFNVYFRDNQDYEVVAFTASQIPGVANRRYPPSLAGRLYPEGIPIVPETMLEDLIKKDFIDVAALSYSDLTYKEVGEKISRVLSAGASFVILGPLDTMLESSKPVIAVTAVRTGSGKSSVSREIALALRDRGLNVVPVRHPMAYTSFEHPVQRFSSIEDLDRMGVTIEEREEYEHYINLGFTVYAGIDYGEVLREVEKIADVILWDGGNNDWPFYRPDFMITVADAIRPGEEVSSFPGEVNVRMADAIIINKADQAPRRSIDEIISNVKRVNPRALISIAESEVYVDDPEAIRGKRVVIVEDAPTITHGGAPYGAGLVAAKKYCVEAIVDPRPHAKGIIAEAYKKYPHIDRVIPSIGYSERQRRDLEETLRIVDADIILSATPIDLTRIISVDKPIVRVYYRVKIVEGPTISELVEMFLERARSKLGGD